MCGCPCLHSDFFADTETFLLQNAKVKQCLQASLTDEDLLLSDCNSASDFQNWFWQGDSLRNHGTQSCLSVVEADRVQISPCDSVRFTSWNCSNSLLFPLGSSQGYLVASKKGVALENVRGLKAQWQSAAERSVCKEKPGQCCPWGPVHTHCWEMWEGSGHPGVFPALGAPLGGNAEMHSSKMLPTF